MQWEYMTRMYNSAGTEWETYGIGQLTDFLNYYGENGWELVSYKQDGIYSYDSLYTCLFKRAKV